MEKATHLTTGKRFQFEVQSSDTVEHLKSLIEKIEGTSPSKSCSLSPDQIDNQALRYTGKQLMNGKLLLDFDIQPECIIHMVVRLLGGSE